MSASRGLSRAAAVVAAGILLSLSTSTAASASSNGIDVVPSRGGVETLVSLVTEAGCPTDARQVTAVMTGPGLPRAGQVVVAPSSVLVSRSGPMELPLSNAFVVYADRNNVAFRGTYTLTARCTDRFGVRTLRTFTTTMRWTTPGTGTAQAERGRFVAASTAGVVGSTTAPTPRADAGLPPVPTPTGSAPSTSTPPDDPGTPRLVDPGERADGSNPNSAQPASSPAPDSGPARWPVAVGAVLVLGALAAAWWWRRRRAPS